MVAIFGGSGGVAALSVNLHLFCSASITRSTRVDFDLSYATGLNPQLCNRYLKRCRSIILFDREERFPVSNFRLRFRPTQRDSLALGLRLGESC